jgi:hypothetical protein
VLTIVEKQLRKTYDNYAHCLKIPYASQNLYFDSNGQLVGISPVGVWTTSGVLQVGKIVVRPDVLQIDGKRILVALRAEKGNSILVPMVTARSVHITIALEPTTSNIDQVNHVMEQVFQKQDTRKRIAAYWRPVPEDQASATRPAGAEVTGMLEGNRPVIGREVELFLPKLCTWRHRRSHGAHERSDSRARRLYR